MAARDSTPSLCSIAGCTNLATKYTWCSKHHARWRRHGDPEKLLGKKASTGSIDSYGYLQVWMRGGGWQLMHHLVVERALGRPLRRPEEVHHVDEDKLNNAGSNLVICPNRKYHALLHIRTNALDACGNPGWRKCPYCKQWDDPANMQQSSRGDSWLHRKCHADNEALRRKLKQ